MPRIIGAKAWYYKNAKFSYKVLNRVVKETSVIYSNVPQLAVQKHQNEYA